MQTDTDDRGFHPIEPSVITLYHSTSNEDNKAVIEDESPCDSSNV